MKECNSCGKCCIKYGADALSVTQEEIALWELFNPEIFQYVKDDEIWFDPNSGAKLTRCPFLEEVPAIGRSNTIKYSCSIYLDRPQDCRQYPSEISEMIRDDCDMIEVVDLENQKRAQLKLDILMRDSRS